MESRIVRSSRRVVELGGSFSEGILTFRAFFNFVSHFWEVLKDGANVGLEKVFVGLRCSWSCDAGVGISSSGRLIERLDF